jgi:hypothetical protein
MVGEVRFGWNAKSGGVEVRQGGISHWLRVHARRADAKSTKLSTGIRAAQSLKDVAKPELISGETWIENGVIWEVDLMSFIPDAVCSPTPDLWKPIPLDARWFLTLHQSLHSLATQPTERIAVRQDLVTRRMAERYGANVKSTILSWATVHGDLHWANLTSPTCWILDWEAWGSGPAAFDAALLYCFSLATPAVAEQVRRNFENLLNSPDGRTTQLFVCAELLRMVELHGDYPDLGPLLEQHAMRVIAGQI